LERTQLQLIQAAKLESVGTLAAGVAHEVKNPLQTMLMGIAYLTHNVPGENENLQWVLKDMQDAVKRADAIIRELLHFSAAARFQMQAEDLNGIVERSLRLTANELLATQVRVVRDLGPALPSTCCDRAKLEQVFINLFINAAQAMAGGGTLTVRTRGGRPGPDVLLEDRIARQFNLDSAVVVAEVLDTGGGIPKEQLAKIFDPFFTTKPVGVGTGLGLSVVKRIVDLHGGVIDVTNAELGGTRVLLVLRASEGQA